MPDQVDWRGLENDATAGHAVGRLLRDQREARGLSVADVATSLRIRRTYIEAIERGRFEELPGAAYIPAFLRAYARHVGLEAEKVLTAYQLSGSVPIERPVSLPADFPLAEKRAPIGLFVLTVLLLVGAGYGVWHYMPRQQAVVAEKVPPVPDRLLASRPASSPPTTSTTPSTTSEVARAPAASPATAPTMAPQAPISTVAPAASVSAPTPPTVPSTPAPAAPPSAPQQVQDTHIWPAPRQDAQTPPPPPAVIAVPAVPPAVIAAPSVGQALAAQPPSVDGRNNTPPAAETQEAVARPAPPPENTDSALLVAVPTKADTQIVVRANSWIELRSPNGDVLAQTYVRAGESYVVPAGISYRIIDAAR